MSTFGTQARAAARAKGKSNSKGNELCEERSPSRSEGSTGTSPRTGPGFPQSSSSNSNTKVAPDTPRLVFNRTPYDERQSPSRSGGQISPRTGQSSSSSSNTKVAPDSSKAINLLGPSSVRPKNRYRTPSPLLGSSPFLVPSFPPLPPGFPIRDSQRMSQQQVPLAPSAKSSSFASSATASSPGRGKIPHGGADFTGLTRNLYSPDSVSHAFTSPAQNLHWQLLSYHLARPNLFIHFDVASPIHDIEYRQDSAYVIQRMPLSDADFDKPAADKKLTKMTINFQHSVFKWDIDVERDEGIRVRDVFEAIYAAFDVPLTPYEQSLMPLRLLAGCGEAFRLRCNLAPVLPITQQRQGWKRVDALLHGTIFCGLTQSNSGGDWSLNLSGTMSKAIDRRRLISDHIAADPTVRYRTRGLPQDLIGRRYSLADIYLADGLPLISKLDLKTAAPHPLPPPPVLELPDEYLLPYPNQTSNVPPEHSNIDLFNLPLSAAFVPAFVDSDVMLTLWGACRICNFVCISPILQHGALHTLLNNIPLIMEPSSRDYTWAFFCRFVPLCALFDSPGRGPIPMIQLGSDRARLIERLEADFENPRNAMSWLHGPSGTGKSVIAYTLASRCRQKHRLAGSFFFSRRHANCRSARSVVLALAYQLGLSQPQAKEKIIAALDSDPGIMSPSRDLREQFARLLIEPLEAVHWRSPSRVFVIDAIDQCQDHVPELISLLTRLLSHLDDVGLHIFFTSRDHVEVLIKRHLPPTISDIALDRTDITWDIRLFLRQSFDKIHKRHYLQCCKPWPADEVLDRLVDRAGLYFITASVIVKFVDSRDHDPTDRMDFIYHLPFNPSPSESSVDEFYKSTISVVDDLEQAYLHLTIVANLAGMLSCSQLDNLLNRGTNQTFEMCSMLSQLSPLVHIPDGHDSAVQVCHESLCDFLSDPLRCGDQFISQAVVHRLLAYSSLSVMIEELPDDSGLYSRLSWLATENSPVSLGAFDNAGVLSFAVYLPPEPLPFLSALWHIMQRQNTGRQTDSRTELALQYFCRVWQILQHLDLSTVDTLPAFRFLANIRSLPVLLAFPIFLSFESPRNVTTLDPSTLEHDPHIETLDAVAEIVTDVHALKDQRNTGSGALNYACTHWAYHLSLAEWDDDLRSILTAFMKQKLQQWLVKAWCLQDLESCLRTLCEVQELYLTANPSIRVDPDAQRTNTNVEEEAEGTLSVETILQNIQESADASNRLSMEQAKECVDEAIADAELERKTTANHTPEITAKEDVEILSDVDTDSSARRSAVDRLSLNVGLPAQVPGNIPGGFYAPRGSSTIVTSSSESFSLAQGYDRLVRFTTGRLIPPPVGAMTPTGGVIPPPVGAQVLPPKRLPYPMPLRTPEPVTRGHVHPARYNTQSPPAPSPSTQSPPARHAPRQVNPAHYPPAQRPPAHDPPA